MITRLGKWLLILLSVLALDVSQAQDWPNLQRFQKENIALLAGERNKNLIVFMGNSITEGWSNIRPEFFEDKPYVNRGIGGQTTPQMLLRFRQDVIQLRPMAVVILAGINDIAGNTGPATIEMIYDNMVSMVELAQASEIKVLLCSVLPAADFPWRPGLKPAEKVIALNDRLKAYAREQQLIYVDYFSAMANPSNGLKEDLGSDGVHPNEKGYRVMEPILEEALALLEKND